MQKILQAILIILVTYTYNEPLAKQSSITHSTESENSCSCYRDPESIGNKESITGPISECYFSPHSDPNWCLAIMEPVVCEGAFAKTAVNSSLKLNMTPNLFLLDEKKRKMCYNSTRSFSRTDRMEYFGHTVEVDLWTKNIADGNNTFLSCLYKILDSGNYTTEKHDQFTSLCCADVPREFDFADEIYFSTTGNAIPHAPGEVRTKSQSPELLASLSKIDLSNFQFVTGIIEPIPCEEPVYSTTSTSLDENEDKNNPWRDILVQIAEKYWWAAVLAVLACIHAGVCFVSILINLKKHVCFVGPGDDLNHRPEEAAVQLEMVPGNNEEEHEFFDHFPNDQIISSRV